MLTHKAENEIIMAVFLSRMFKNVFMNSSEVFLVKGTKKTLA